MLVGSSCRFRLTHKAQRAFIALTKGPGKMEASVRSSEKPTLKEKVTKRSFKAPRILDPKNGYTCFFHDHQLWIQYIVADKT